ncbi:BON domain-containing protein [Maribacter sp. CXY002]|uniref:BON domain-containing protein n=1 Tax=Maribacter luteocoastalis TaxID=3407671 RepID=UPI003B680663
MKTDAQIKKDISEELVWHPNIDEAQIGIIVEDGVATLTGYVNDYTTKLAVENAVKGVAGVRAVATDIDVKFSENYKKTDMEIAKAVVNALEWNTLIPKDSIMVKVDNGFVYLSGSVPWEYQKNAAKNTVENLIGVKGVINTVQIDQNVSTVEVKEKIKNAYKRSASIDSAKINVTVDGSTITLAGTVTSIIEKEEAEKAAYLSPGITKVKNELKVQYYPEYSI